MMNVNVRTGIFARAGAAAGRRYSRSRRRARSVSSSSNAAIALDRAQNHRAAMRGIGLRLVAIVLVAGRNEEHAVEPFEQARRLRNEEMRVVDRIEGAAENADSHEYVNSYGPMRTVSPSAAPSSRSFFSTPIFPSARSKRASASSESKFVIAARRSTRSPETTNAPSSRAFDYETRRAATSSIRAGGGATISGIGAVSIVRADRIDEIAHAFAGRGADAANLRKASLQFDARLARVGKIELVENEQRRLFAAASDSTRRVRASIVALSCEDLVERLRAVEQVHQHARTFDVLAGTDRRGRRPRARLRSTRERRP